MLNSFGRFLKTFTTQLKLALLVVNVFKNVRWGGEERGRAEIRKLTFVGAASGIRTTTAK